MPSSFTLPEKTSSDVRSAFQQVQGILDTMEVPMIFKRRSLNGIKNGKRALYFDGENLWTYTRCGGKLYRNQWEEV